MCLRDGDYDKDISVGLVFERTAITLAVEALVTSGAHFTNMDMDYL